MSSVTTSQDSQLSESVSDGNGPRPHRVVSVPGDDIWPLVYHPDGRRIVSRSDNGTIRLWNMENGEQEGESMKHEGRTGHRLVVTRDGTRIISGNENGSVRVWDVESQEIRIGEPWTIPHWTRHISLSPDGLKLASASSANTVLFWDAISGHPIAQHLDHESSVNGTSFSPSGEFVASATRNGKMYLWRVPWLEPVESPPQRVISVPDHDIWPFVYHPDGRRIVIHSDDGTIGVWNLENGVQEGESMKHSEGHSTHRLAVTTDGTRIISGNEDGSVRVWDVESQEIGHGDAIWRVLWSRDGSRFVSASEDKVICCWNAHTGEHIGEPWSHPHFIVNLSISPDGSKLASTASDTVRFLDAMSGH
ncbi:WD40 repeat-like protein, partial [Imleria badia]